MINEIVMVKSWIDNIDIAGIEGRDWLMANYILIREGERFKLAKKSKRRLKLYPVKLVFYFVYFLRK